jgi:cold shock CspA family protein/uncharacterized LabA/DUF88 family protein
MRSHAGIIEMASSDRTLTRIGVLYDGTFFSKVSDYYRYHHRRKARISIGGLHDFICNRIAAEEACDQRYCQIVDAHYFRGRHGARYAEDYHLRNDRIFDEVLMREGVVTHHLPLVETSEGRLQEKGIDIWFALEAYELAIYKRFDVSVLVTGDGDFLPLVRKLNTLGTRVMLLAWDFEWTDHNQESQRTRTNQTLLNEVTYPIEMHTIIDSRVKDQIVDNLFLPRNFLRETAQEVFPSVPRNSEGSEIYQGTIRNIPELRGFGFISPDEGGNNLFFFHTAVQNKDFNELAMGDRVEYKIGANNKGPIAVDVRVIQ